MTLGARIVERRRARGLSQRDVAEALSVSVQAVSSWEADKAQPKPNRMGALAVVLGTTPGWLADTATKHSKFSTIDREENHELAVVNIDAAILHLIRDHVFDHDRVVGYVLPTRRTFGRGIAVVASGSNIQELGFSEGDYLIFDAGVFPVKGDIVLKMHIGQEAENEDGLSGPVRSTIEICPDNDTVGLITAGTGGRLGTLVERRTFRKAPVIDDD